MAKLNVRGIALNKNGAIIVASIGDATHIATLRNEHIGFRSPKKASSYSEAQANSINMNIANASMRRQIEEERLSKPNRLRHRK